MLFRSLVCPTDARDIASVFVGAVLHRDKAAGRLINAGAEYAITYNELVKVFGRCYNVSIPVRHVSVDEFTTAAGPEPDKLYHHQAHMCPDIRTAYELLGYFPFHTPEAAVQRAIQWMKEKDIL